MGSILRLGRSLEKEIASHSSILTWEIPWTEEPGGLQAMGSHRVGHNLMTKWRRQLLSSVVIVSTVQQSESAMHIYTHIHTYMRIRPLCFGFPSRLGHRRALGRAPCPTVAARSSSVSYAYQQRVRQSQPPSPSTSPLPLVYIHVFSTSVSLLLLCK